jgi:hypothetical protein
VGTSLMVSPILMISPAFEVGSSPLADSSKAGCMMMIGSAAADGCSSFSDA